MDRITERLSSSSEDRGERLDIFLAHNLRSISREKIKSLIHDGNIAVNRAVVDKPDYRIKGNESIEVYIAAEEPLNLPPPEPINIPLMYEDEHIIVLNKPAGVSTHPTANALHGSVVNALLYMNKRLSNMGDPMRQGIVHRLDKQTCGVLLIAKDNEAHIKLINMFKNRTIQKTYIAVTYNVLKQDSGIISGLINRHPVDRKRMTTKTTKGREAVTRFRVIKKFDNATVVMLSPRTGRTHQLRVQLSDMGYPIINDNTYSRRKPGLEQYQLNRMLSVIDGIALFAYAISFTHPVYNIPVTFSAPFPVWLKEVLKERELY